MENFEDFENKAYEKAERVKYSVADYLRFIFNNLVVALQVMFVLLIEVFITIQKLIIPDKPKSIAGQIALVTGLSLIKSIAWAQLNVWLQ
jgi:hypothetical protein